MTSVPRAQGDPDADAGHDRMAVELHRITQLAAQALREQQHVGGSARSLLDDDELVAAEARHRVVTSHARPKPARDVTEKIVSQLMTQRVVDRLETIEVET